MLLDKDEEEGLRHQGAPDITSFPSPPAYFQTIDSPKLLPLPKALLNAPRSSHYSHIAIDSESTPVLRRAHLFDLSRPVPLAALPKVTRAEEISADGSRVNGFFWNKREGGGVVLNVGAVGGEEDDRMGEGGQRRTRRVRIVAGSEGEGSITISALPTQSPPIPLSLSLLSRSGSLFISIPLTFRGPITFPSYSPPVFLSPTLQALYTPLSDSKGFLGPLSDLAKWNGQSPQLAEDPSEPSASFDEVVLGSSGRIRIGLTAEEEEPPSETSSPSAFKVVLPVLGGLAGIAIAVCLLWSAFWVISSIPSFVVRIGAFGLGLVTDLFRKFLWSDWKEKVVWLVLFGLGWRLLKPSFGWGGTWSLAGRELKVDFRLER